MIDRLGQNYTLEELGGLSFFQMFHKELAAENISMGGKVKLLEKQNIALVTLQWFCPGSRHYSWDKGANILGIGRNNLVKVPVDINCRMDTEFLAARLQECLENRWPVIGTHPQHWWLVGILANLTLWKHLACALICSSSQPLMFWILATGVTVVFGTTQEGAVDDLAEVLRVRQRFASCGLTFTIHIDGAWGGYFASCVKESGLHIDD